MEQGNAPVPPPPPPPEPPVQQIPVTPPPPSGAPKKGLPPLAWAGIGCGVIIIIGVIVISMLVGSCTRKVNQWAKEVQKNPEKTAAEMIVRFNPDLEMVSQDETTGEMTIKVKSSGEEITMSYKDIAEGKITVKDAEGKTTQIGKVDLADLPTWVPKYPNTASTGGAGQQKSATQVSGFMMFTTTDAPEAVSDFFKEQAGKSGMNSTSSSKMNLGGQESLTLECSGGGRSLTVLAAKGGGEPNTTVTVNFEGTP